MWILDTDHISLLQRGHPVVIQRINTVNPQDIATTIITQKNNCEEGLTLSEGLPRLTH